MNEKIGLFSDLHVGHRIGLNPPEYQAGNRKYLNKQVDRWQWFEEKVKEAGPFDVCIWLGDLIDGLGVKNHSECVIGDLNQQIQGAADVVKSVGCDKNYFVYGTMIHTSTKDGLEAELEVAKLINGDSYPQIWGQQWFKWGKYVIDCRHAPAGKSHVPHTRANPLQRERLSNIMWHLEGVQPLSNIILRGHCHYKFIAGEPGTWMAYALPALQGLGSKYGRILSNVVHEGFCTLTSNGESWPLFELYEMPRELEAPIEL